MEKFYPSTRKYDRARAVVERFDDIAKSHPDRADVKFAIKGRAEKLEGEALVDFVYNGLMGAPIITGAKAKEAQKKADEAKKRSAKKRGAALKREKITVK